MEKNSNNESGDKKANGNIEDSFNPEFRVSVLYIIDMLGKDDLKYDNETKNKARSKEQGARSK